MQGNSINRFSVRADNYDKYRPGYPPELFSYLTAAAGLEPDDAIADIGAGTGIFTAELAKWKNPVFAVEPNPQMRHLAGERLAGFPNCSLIDGTAETTTLPGQRVKFITCAQAFHWFNPEECRKEFNRIAQPGAKAAIIWNRRNSESEFEQAYEQLIMRYSTDYPDMTQYKVKDQDMLQFFRPWTPDYQVFEHTDSLDFRQLQGRTFSYSFMPEETDEAAGRISLDLRKLFDDFQVNGHVNLSYRTRLFLSILSS